MPPHLEEQRGLTSEPPERSLRQRMDALGRANRIRTYRAGLKTDVKYGRISITDVLLNPPPEVATMQVFDLLMSAPSKGRVKVNRMLTLCRISPSKTVGGLTERQRGELIRLMRR